MKGFWKEFWKIFKLYLKKDTWKFQSENKHDLYLCMLICMSFTLVLWLLTISCILQ